MNTQSLSVVYRVWKDEAGRYEPTRVLWLDLNHGIRFGGIQISFGASLPISDPTDTSAAIVLRKLGLLQRKLHLLESRFGWQVPKAYVIGGTIMCESDFFYISNLREVEYVRIYGGDPEEHPEVVEMATPAFGAGNE
jgi:hypothetical protein